MNTLEISNAFPLPTGKRRDDSEMGKLRLTLRAMEKGQSFLWNSNAHGVYRAANEAGVKITIRKLEQGGWRVWRRE